MFWRSNEFSFTSEIFIARRRNPSRVYYFWKFTLSRLQWRLHYYRQTLFVLKNCIIKNASKLPIKNAVRRDNNSITSKQKIIYCNIILNCVVLHTDFNILPNRTSNIILLEYNNKNYSSTLKFTYSKLNIISVINYIHV